MQKDENNQRTCENCGNFIRHYACIRGEYRRVRGCGQCLCNEISNAEVRKRVARQTFCSYWVPYEIQVENRRETLKTKLLKTIDRIEEIADILKMDEE